MHSAAGFAVAPPMSRRRSTSLESDNVSLSGDEFDDAVDAKEVMAAGRFHSSTTNRRYSVMSTAGPLSAGAAAAAVAAAAGGGEGSGGGSGGGTFLTDGGGAPAATGGGAGLVPAGAGVGDTEVGPSQSDFIYIPDEEHFSVLDEHCDSEHGPNIFTVLGDPGHGKSALLANWAERRMAQNATKPQGSFLFQHFADTTQHDKLSKMLHRLESALREFFQLRLEVRKTPDQLKWDLPRFLEAASKRAQIPIVIVIDGLSILRMESGEEADPMMWLPRLLPPQIRVVVSVTEHIVSVDSPLPDSASPRRTRSYVELKRRACPMLVVQPLRPEARDRILRHYVDRHKVTP